MAGKKKIQKVADALDRPEPEIVTRIAQSYAFNAGKYAELFKQAKLLGAVRKEVWQRFGSLNGVGVMHRSIRDQWVKTRDFSPLPAKAWKETLRDGIENIALYEAAAKKKIKRAISKNVADTVERKRLLTHLKDTHWTREPYLCRLELKIIF